MLMSITRAWDGAAPAPGSLGLDLWWGFGWVAPVGWGRVGFRGSSLESDKVSRAAHGELSWTLWRQVTTWATRDELCGFRTCIPHPLSLSTILTLM